VRLAEKRRAKSRWMYVKIDAMNNYKSMRKKMNRTERNVKAIPDDLVLIISKSPVFFFLLDI